MKKAISLTVMSLGLLGLMGCGSTAEKANTQTTPNTAQNKEPAKSVLKPGDVSPDKAVKVSELVNAAEEAAWKGKEVAVTGYVSGTSSSGDRHQLLTLINEPGTSNTGTVSCLIEGDGDKASELFLKTIEVKGKIRYVQGEGDSKRVNLEPCEIKK